MKRIILTVTLVLVCMGAATLYLSCSTLKTAEEFADRGCEYYEKYKLDKAIADYTKAIQLDPDYANAYYWRGSAYSDKGELDKAIADYTKAIQLGPDYANAYSWRAFIYGEKGDFDKSIADYTQALRFYSDEYDIFITNIKITNAKFKKTIAEYSEAIRLNSKDAEAYFKRGYAYYSKIPNAAHLNDSQKYIVNLFTNHYWDLAVLDWEAVIKINPNYVEAKNALESIREQPFVQVSDPRWEKWEAEMVKDKTYVGKGFGVLEYLLYRVDESASETNISEQSSFHLAFMAYLEELGFIVDYSSVESRHNTGLSKNVKRLMAKHKANISVTSGPNNDGSVSIIINIDTSYLPKPKGSNIPNYDFVTFDIYQK